MIGDGLHDIHAARAAGVPVCAVAYGLGDPEELRRAGPDFFCETVDDLKKMFV
jgi:phosphoglycolate phosphatase